MSQMKRIYSSIREGSYFQYLCEILGSEMDFNKSYNLLLRTLHYERFEWSVPNDDNRINDALDFREDFFDTTYYSPYVYGDLEKVRSYRPSVLEVLVAISKRYEEQVELIGEDNHMALRFWELISNLGLDIYDDQHYEELNGTYEILKIVKKWVAREYDKDGKGGIFPLRDAKEDQRKVEIWYQMMAYLLENYDF